MINGTFRCQLSVQGFGFSARWAFAFNACHHGSLGLSAPTCAPRGRTSHQLSGVAMRGLRAPALWRQRRSGGRRSLSFHVAILIRGAQASLEDEPVFCRAEIRKLQLFHFVL